MHKFFGI